jgi:molybdate transport system ATP-binding protein
MKAKITSIKPKYEYEFSVNNTGIIGVYGISGSGKSSLLNAIAGYQDDYKGIISFNNKELKGIIKCSYMNQNALLFPHWTIKENLDFAMKHSQNKMIHLDQLINALDCFELMDKYPRQLSGGEKQRIAFVRALVQIEQNSLVLLDEPFSALDPSLRKVALRILNEYKHKSLILLVTHEIADIYQYADELLYIHNGRISLQDNIHNAMSSNHKTLPIASRVIIENNTHVIYAEAVSINLQKNESSSISHQLEITIEDIQLTDNMAILKLNYQASDSSQFLYARLTNDSIKRLNLIIGQKAFACFKSTH